MPLPLVPGSPTHGWLVLAGGGEFSFGETDEIDRFLLEKMPTQRRSVAFIPAASGSNEYAVHLAAHLRKLDAMVEVRNVPIYRTRDARRAKNLALLRDAGMVYIGGGVTNSLLDAARDTPLSGVLAEVLDAGGVVAGIGAGASALGSWAPDMHRPANAIRGMGLVPGAAVVTTYDPSDDELLRRMMSLEEIRVGYGIPPGVALAVAPDRSASILGNGSVAVVRKS